MATPAKKTPYTFEESNGTKFIAARNAEGRITSKLFVFEKKKPGDRPMTAAMYAAIVSALNSAYARARIGKA